MRFKGKNFLLGLLLIIISFSGVFAAWVFNDGLPTLDEETLLGGDTTPEHRWEFEEASITFNAGSLVEDDIEYVGKFSDGETEKTSNVVMPQSMSFQTYASLVPSEPKLYDAEGNVNEDYIFAYWRDINNVNDIFHFDESITTTTVLVAVYVPVSNPGIYYRGERIATFYNNPNNLDEFMTSNFMFTQTYDQRIDYDANDVQIGYNCLYIVDGSSTYYCTNKENGEDKVAPGVYTVYYNRVENIHYTWQLYGGHAYFQRQDRFSLVGNPSTSWHVQDVGAKQMFFGYQSETVDSNKNVLTKTYVLDGVEFSDEEEVTSTYGYKFKIYNSNFGTWPTNSISSDSTSYIEQTNDINGNLKLKDNVEKRKFDITIVVSFNVPTDADPVAYPKDIKVSLTPASKVIRFYNEDKSAYEELDVPYGEKISEEDYFDMFPEEVSGQAPNCWLDADTNSVVDILNLEMTKNQFVYPSYKEDVPTAYIRFVNNFDFLTNKFDDTSYTEVALYGNQSVTQEIINSISLNDGFKTELSAKSYTISNWTSSLKTGDDVIGGTYKFGKTYYLYPYIEAFVHRTDEGEISYLSVTEMQGYDVSLNAGSVFSISNVLGNELTDLEIRKTDNYEVDYNGYYNLIYKLYFNPGSVTLWDQDGAWFAAWIWGGQYDGDGYWKECIDESGDRLLEFTVNYDSSGLLFARKDPKYSTFDWNNIWNRVDSQTIPTTQNNLFSITSFTSGTYYYEEAEEKEYSKGTWSYYEPHTHSYDYENYSVVKTSSKSDTGVLRVNCSVGDCGLYHDVKLPVINTTNYTSTFKEVSSKASFDIKLKSAAITNIVNSNETLDDTKLTAILTNLVQNVKPSELGYNYFVVANGNTVKTATSLTPNSGDNAKLQVSLSSGTVAVYQNDTKLTIDYSSVKSTSTFIIYINSSNKAYIRRVINFTPGVWNADGAWYSAWVWGGSKDGSGYWVNASSNKFEINPDSTSMKVLRKGPSHTSGNWTCWNQTGDITISTSKNTLSITGWSSSNFSWS